MFSTTIISFLTDSLKSLFKYPLFLIELSLLKASSLICWIMLIIPVTSSSESSLINKVLILLADWFLISLSKTVLFILAKFFRKSFSNFFQIIK